MDPANRTLDSMIVPSDPSQLAAFTETQILNDARPLKRRAVTKGEDGSLELDEEDEDDPGDVIGSLWNPDAGPSTQKTLVIPESECEFSSVLNLRKAVKKRGNLGTETSSPDGTWLNPVQRSLRSSRSTPLLALWTRTCACPYSSTTQSCFS